MSSADREGQQIDPEKMLRKNEDPSSDEDHISCPSTQPLPRRGFLGASSSPDSESPLPPLSSLSTSDISNDDSLRVAETEDSANYGLSRSYGTPNPAFRKNESLSPRKEIAERNKTKMKKKRVMSTTANTFSPMASPGSPFESPMITSITKGVRLPPTQEESDPLRRDQQIDPEKQMMRRDHPIDEDERPEAPSTGPLPRRAIPGGPAGALKPKALFLDGGEGDSEGEEGELTFKKEKVASAGSITTGSLEDREKRLTQLEQTLAQELEELRLFKQRLMEKEAELNEREKKLPVSTSSPN